MVPQELRVSQVLCIIYLPGIFERVENEGCESISFVEDVAWVVEGESVRECTEKLEECAMKAQDWAKENACNFDWEKTEVMLFMRKRSNKEPKIKAKITVRNHEV